MTLASFVISLLGLVCGMVAGLWAVYNAIAKKIDDIDRKNLLKIEELAQRTADRANQLAKDVEDRSMRLAKDNDDKSQRIYERMDENKKSYYDNFVLVKVYEENKKHQKELTDEKFISILKVFETNMSALSKELKDFKDLMINRLGDKILE